MITFLTIFWSIYALGAIFTFMLAGSVILDSLKNPEEEIHHDMLDLVATAGPILGYLIVTTIVMIGLIGKSLIWWYWFLPSKKESK